MQFHKELVVIGFSEETGEVDFTTRDFIDREVTEWDGSIALWGAVLLPELKGKDVREGQVIVLDINLPEVE